MLVFGRGPAQRLDDATLTSEVEYSIRFTKLEKIF